MVLLHILAIFVTGITVMYADEQGLMWMLGKKVTLSERKVEILHALVSVGLALVILTGGLLALRTLEYYLSDTRFLLKMGFVGALVINGFFVGSFSRMATRSSFASLSLRERLPLLISGAISVAGWGGALIAGFMLGD
jgi:hypothetical protein